ncbi:MAG TPA: S26 family signal peptidase [Candidatus Poseidoniia archaeon]|jgi:signal peptidase|nr:S26 family signal peptidase [Candidatus Poseidoniia archaeon]|tara:strand:+ start:169 stop:1008 length:840 start_codon:yes stop_codon:yes gene_type:complete
MTKFDELHLPDTVKDVGIAIGCVVLVFLLTFAYSGNWPPMVVIESGSMEHDNNPLYAESGYAHLGTIDTGDLVIVKEARKTDIVTYLEGKDTGYEKYGDYGDVIVYYKNGIREKDGQPVTPVIHRAMFWVDVDVENKTYHVPEAGRTFYNEIDLGQFGDGKLVGTIEGQVLQNSGYVTKGDSTGNPHPDQVTHFDINGNKVQPVDPDWVVGMARGELPWFGLIKLRVTQPDNYEQAPPGCRGMLGFSIMLILLGPYTAGKIWESYTEQTGAPPKKKSKS